jgi:nitrite reductase (NADH) large subunit
MRLVIIGGGMVGHRLISSVLDRGYEITVFCEEPRAAYDRVHLTSLFGGKTADDLALEPHEGVTMLVGDKAVDIDREARVVTAASGREVRYDKLVLATGSAPFVPPIPGRDVDGCFVYRTIEDVEAIRARAEHSRVGVVVGGGLLGLEAAGALVAMGLETHVVEFAPRLMALQVDEAGGLVLRRRIEALGVKVHTSTSTTNITPDRRMQFADGSELATDLIVFSAGIRPRDELARAAGLATGERGGIVVDEQCRTSDLDIYAIGECALAKKRIFGLVAPGYEMARVVAADLAGEAAAFTGFDMSTKLKLLGVDVASFGDAHAQRPGAQVMSLQSADVYKKLVVSPDQRELWGGVLVGDASAYGQLLAMMNQRTPLPRKLEDVLVGNVAGDALVCSCNNVSRTSICEAIAQGLTSVGAIKACTKAGTGCGSCVPILTELLAKAQPAAPRHLCEHFPHSRQELYHLVRVHRIRTFDQLLSQHGQGRGCEICKPAVASILASAWNEHILDRRHLPLQDTNDRFLANIQHDGTYSVVPRVPGGEITPEKLIVLGQVAQKYGLYTKITGGQRIDLFGARLEQLPEIWSELVAAGFESGHAYGKALRTVKSCVGTTWCRYGVQDSVSFAIYLENRYKGLRSPHKVKAAVSGCARECAEAQGKDFGLIATEKDYNLYLGGNGGMKPQHALLFATDLDERTVVRYLDRFLMFYIRTADRLQRTASWLNNLEGGIEYLKQVIIEDSLGLGAELEAEMAHVVGSYRCEWKAALEDPEKLKLFRRFVNTDEPDQSIVRIRSREQLLPPKKRAAG